MMRSVMIHHRSAARSHALPEWVRMAGPCVDGVFGERRHSGVATVNSEKNGATSPILSLSKWLCRSVSRASGECSIEVI